MPGAGVGRRSWSLGRLPPALGDRVVERAADRALRVRMRSELERRFGRGVERQLLRVAELRDRPRVRRGAEGPEVVDDSDGSALSWRT